MLFSSYRLVAIITLLSTIQPSQGGAQLEHEQAFPNLSFTRPVDFQNARDGSNRIFVVEQRGVIYVFENVPDVSAAAVFLDISDRVNDSGNEEGLLGLAFHPDYEMNGYFFVDYTALNPRRTVVARYQVDAENENRADRNSELVLLEIAQPFSNHNGGQISFGPDGCLYIAAGDGGSAGDPLGNGQNRATLLGTILRIDVDNPSGGKNYGIPADNPFVGNASGFKEEIYAYGLRNPWRFSFDAVTGSLWVADVGQNKWEEIDIIEKGSNYGWNIVEGNFCFNPLFGCNTTGLTPPVWEYSHSVGSSVTGGFVYRGANVPDLIGAYIYADYVSGRIWSLQYDGVNPLVNTELIDTNLFISSFGVDENNELYICAFDGKIYRFKSTIVSSVEGNSNLPNTLDLAQNYPNPFNPETTIQLFLPETAFITLTIFNIRGREIKNLVNEHKTRGKHTFIWEGTDFSGKPVSSGVYFYSVTTGAGLIKSRKMLFIK